MKIFTRNGRAIGVGYVFVRREISKSNPRAKRKAKPTFPGPEVISAVTS